MTLTRDVNPTVVQIKELTFQVFRHEQPITAMPLVGVRPIDIGLGISFLRNRKYWSIDFLNLEQYDLHVPRANGQKQRPERTPIILAAMMALRAEGVDPLAVRGWGVYFNSNQVRLAKETYEQWVATQ